MAAVFVPPSPQTQNMSTRRPPLANVPNATNSPARSGVLPTKRSRTASTQLDIPYGQPPPKKQVVDGVEQDARSPTRTKSTANQPGDSRLFSRRANNGQPSAFERKLHAAREKDRQTVAKPVRNEKPSAETLDTIRQWQRHYRKVFPTFVFYFDSIPEDARSKCSRQVNALGAREEKFFSRVVTHVVTSRPIPPENSAITPAEGNRASVDHADGSLQTVNPSLLEKNPEMHVHMSLKHDARREQSNMDVLHRARQMGMKIWALEKLQRMISTINDPDISGHHDNPTRNNHVGGGNARARGETDLSQVLRNELVNGPSDRDHLSSLKELVTFKGPFIYVHDMNEKTRPVMVREYPKVARRQDGAWPQFRSAALGKCPFLDEPPTRKELDRQRTRQEKKLAPKNDPKLAHTHESKNQALAVHEHGVKQEHANDENLEDGLEKHACQPHQPEMQDMVPPKQGSPRKSSESFIPPQAPRTGPFYTGREPAASGMQPSNITSAIRSQMVSSTAAAPGAKAGLSKEVHGLKRKVLEKGNGGMPAGTSHNGPTDLSTSWKMKDQNQRLGKANPVDKLGHVNEENISQTEAQRAAKKQSRSMKDDIQKKERPRDPKPGYCENCRDKFDDFEAHTQTRKHRRFALTTSNWVELDDLLCELERPLKAKHHT